MITVRRIFAVTLTVVCLVTSIPSYSAAGWTGVGKITELNLQPSSSSSAGFEFVNISVEGNPSGCTIGNGFYFSTSDDRRKRMFATLLAAQMAARDVLVYVTGACQWGYAEMDGLRVQ
jgi:hypothetical protein